MNLIEKLPSGLLTVRGWGFVLTAVVALLFAQVLGRRDLLYVGVLLLALPLASVVVLRLVKPRFTVNRRFQPQTMEIGSTSTVTLSLTASVAGGASIAMEERLPARFGQAPRFSYPSRNPTRDGVSLYEYRIRSTSRGVYDIGPVTAEFTDPFGLGKSRHVLGTADPLVVTPAPVELLGSALAGSRGNDGMAVTRRQANPSDDDVMTREYRHGDSLRRVHWAATARHSELMVRQEESVTTPQATLLLDRRHSSFSTGFSAVFGADAGDSTLSTSPTFEWAVTAAMSISAHLLERGYALRFLDQQGAPALLHSPSAPLPSEEEHHGQGAVEGIAEGLAALGLAPETGHRAPGHVDRSGSTAVRAGEAARSAVRRVRGQEAETPAKTPHARTPHAVFGDDLLDRLAATRHRGPLIAVLGLITTEEAHVLASASDYGSPAYAILAADRPADSRAQLDILREAGWHATAASPSAGLPAVWAGLEHAVGRSAAHASPAAGPTPSGRPDASLPGSRP
ncbi:DUF58 domain-containing protein [Arthrobacter pityocampae]|uniref:DUF58 domain-containing protein n=1 Tax=Arthrobacter pityocampae TaxID=547334 RepID=A0A2S5IYH7_9MICC|nr:DUF58 domain-containing protein [Arthrobacter pityocampae]PPB49609.1 DUF58 domain-containing protein [Arthrobacter pityocampae]